MSVGCCVFFSISAGCFCYGLCFVVVVVCLFLCAGCVGVDFCWVAFCGSVYFCGCVYVGVDLCWVVFLLLTFVLSSHLGSREKNN